MKEKKIYCVECNESKYFEKMNELEKEEYGNEGSFICINCINKEREKK